jgi:hypothetical protein
MAIVVEFEHFTQLISLKCVQMARIIKRKIAEIADYRICNTLQVRGRITEKNA